MTKKMNYYGTILTDKYYLLPEPGHFALPLIKTPVVISEKSEIIDWTFATQRDAFIHSCGCPKCKSDIVFSTLDFRKPTISNWHCAICGHDWKTYRGIFIKPLPVQMSLFEAVSL